MADNPSRDVVPEPPAARGDESAPAPAPAVAAAPHPAPLAPSPPRRKSPMPSREFLLITAGVVFGLILGIYRTKIRDSVGVLEELWTLVSPVVATVASTVLGSVFQEHGFKGAFAKRLGSVLLLSVLLTLSAEGFIRAAKDLVVGRQSPPAAVQSVAPAAPASAPAPAPTSQPAPAATQPVVDDAATKAPQSPPQRAGQTSAPGSAGPPRVSRANAPAKSDATVARCSELNARGSIGETLTAEERDFLARNCGK